VGDDEGEVPLRVWGSGEQPSKARRRAGVVYREAGPWSPAVLALLRHLEREGFVGAPRVVGSGFAEDGREMVGYVPGASPQPRAWAEAIEFAVTPETRTCVTGTGFPFAWAIAWRVRSASWMLTHRSALQRAIG